MLALHLVRSRNSAACVLNALERLSEPVKTKPNAERHTAVHVSDWQAQRWRPSMKPHAPAAILSIAALAFGVGLSRPSEAAFASARAMATPIQYDRYGPYDRYPEQPRGYYPGERYYPPERPDGFGGFERGLPRWRAGDVVPPEVLDFVVVDWDERGLGRPPSGHQWVRVDPQFVLVRERDRMIARVINFH
jgi:Ni/Co efflux regulator RcnB